jgi:hypothetical protein
MSMLAGLPRLRSGQVHPALPQRAALPGGPLTVGCDTSRQDTLPPGGSIEPGGDEDHGQDWLCYEIMRESR